MGIVRHLQHWVGGGGPRIRVRGFVPEDHDLRLWADTFPWEKMVEAIEASIARRYPEKNPQGRSGVSTRVLWALEILKAQLNCSDEEICSRLRTDFAVMYACGIEEVQANRTQRHFVLPEVLSQFRNHLDEPLLEELLQIQATAAIEQGLVSPEHVVVDTFATQQGSQRVTDATTLYKAKKKSSTSSGKSAKSSRKRR